MKIDDWFEPDWEGVQMLVLAPGTEKETEFLQEIATIIKAENGTEDGKFSAFMKFGKLHIVRRAE